MSWQALPSRAVAPRSSEQRRASVTAVIEWAEIAGASLHGVAARVDAGGNAAMYATREIAQGELIFALPRRLMIIDRDVAPGAASAHAALAAWLAVAVRDPASPWRVYLDDLPPHLPELPLFRSAGDLAALAGTTAHFYAAADRRDLLAAHASLGAPLPLADFAWGWAIVRSRAYHAPGSFDPHLAMMPIVDLFDHGHGDTTWTYDPTPTQFAITAERAIGRGEPVTFTYGDIGNGKLLAHYGFTMPADPFAEALLMFDDENVPLSSLRDRLDEPADERADALYADAVRRSLAALAGDAPATGDRAWDMSCARVRAGERAVLAQLAARR